MERVEIEISPGFDPMSRAKNMSDGAGFIGEIG